jgi:uncharacterized protein (DUF2147 family)
MRRICPSIVGLALIVTPALAAEPVGEWEVENGYARVRIENCGDSLWGAISWEKRPGGVDENNRDPNLRARPILGMPILLDMKPKRDRWEGEVYNSNDGRIYSANIRLVDPDTLRLEGCVLSIFCGGQNWTRVAPQQTQSQPGQAASRPPARPSQSDGRATPSRTTAAQQANAAARANQEFCSSVTGLPGGTHQDGLKQNGRR